VPGWTITTKPVKFDPPIKTDDGDITDGVGEIIYTAAPGSKGIPVGGPVTAGLGRHAAWSRRTRPPTPGESRIGPTTSLTAVAAVARTPCARTH
jgi:hypothetical protein